MAILDNVIDKIQDLETPWEGKTGEQVEDFISRQMKNTVTRFEFDQSSSTLNGYNSFDSDPITTATVVNATPIYIPKLEIINVRINSNNNDLKTGQNIELNQPSIKKIEVGIRFTVEYEILGKYYYGISPQAVKFSLGGQTFTKDRVIPNSQSDLEAIQYVDVTSLFNSGVSEGTLSASCAINDQIAEASYGGKVTVKKIIISYTNKGYVEGNVVSFNISGLLSSEISSYRLIYLDNGSTVPVQVDLQYNNKVDIDLSTGTHQLYARIEYKSNAGLFYSNWVQTNLIVNCNQIQGNAVAVINSVPTEINNCSNALLYKICYASGTNGGNIVINSYISDTWDDVNQLPNTKLDPFNSTTLTLMGGEAAGEKEFYSYFELEAVGERDARYIGFTINGQAVYSYEGDGSSSNTYYTVDIVENPYNINNAFNHVSGAILDYSQINGSGSNVFNEDNIQLQPGDGWGIDGKYTAFQISASGQNLFKQALDFSSYLNNGFTFEFLVRTYNVNGDDYVLRIGNLLLGPGYVRVYEDPDPEEGYALDSVYVNSKADFQKNAVTHILVTYTKEYRPSTYMDTYNQLLSTPTAKYQTSSDVKPYNVLKVYINGVINREIQLVDSQLKENGRDFKLQIYPTSSDLKIYGFRTYNYPFNYEEVKKNRISAFLEASDKKSFYDKNDILDEQGKISLRKCLNKYNVLVYAIPTNDCPLYYGNKSTAGDEQSAATLLVHYADPGLVNYNGRLWDGKYKAQGSSAKKYLIHNCQYNIKKGKFLTEAEIAHNATAAEGGAIEPRDYYQLPGSDIKVKKLVGKVNYASSMQTHKQGACNTYDDTYKSVFSAKLDEVFPLGSGRKACMENEFLYFYYNITPEQDLSTITIQDTLDNARFIGFQTWGSAKADDPTYGYDEDKTPEYLLFEGADNGNPGANFKVPWAAFQTYDSTLSSLDAINQQLGKETKKSYTVGLLIDDETIKYGKNNDPLDVDYGAAKFKPYYNEETNPVYEFESVALNTSLPYFVEFYNAMYQYDFTSYISTGELNITDVFDVSNTYESRDKKIYISASSLTVTNSANPDDKSVTSAKRFDVFRWDAVRNKWVPAGLHFGDIEESKGGTWETFNIVEQYLDYTNRDLYKNFSETGEIDIIRFGYTGSIGDNQLKSHVFPAMKDMFICACKTYLDVEDVAFHQAMIRVLSGTDNRAKNTYFQIIGKIYENGEPTDKGDYKIRLMQDDLDTIFATDNNGQQNKEYYLLEPAFNKATEGRWGDDHSSLFYPFDLCFAKQINQYTGNIIHYLLGNGNVEDIETHLYNNFLRIQQYFPAIAYNHTAEIYYELAQTIYQNGTKLYEGGDFNSLLNGYVNNSVKDPLSLSHGSSYEGEVQFLQDRLLLLATLTGEGSGLQKSAQSLVNAGTGEGDQLFTVKGNAQYINYFYPNYLTASSNYTLILKDANKENIDYDPMIDNLNIFPNDKYDKTVINSISVPNTLYPISLTGPTLTGFAISNSNQYKYLEITEGLDHLVSLMSLSSAAYLIIDGATTNYRITAAELQVYQYLPVIEELILTNVQFNNTVLDFRNCNRLRKLDLSGCTRIESVILPEGGKLSEVILPSCIKSISILNNPNLSSITFEDGTKLNSLSINCNGVNSEFNINELIRNYYNFEDPILLKLTGGCDLDLDVLTSISLIGEYVSLQGSYRVVEEGEKVAISYQLKKDLVKAFGNIDNVTNVAYIDYESEALSKNYAVYEQVIYGCSFVAGSANVFYPFDSIYFTRGNDVLVNNDGTLNITYWLDNKAPASVDSVTGEVIVNGNATTEYAYSVTIYSKESGAIKIEGKIYFGYREPEVGDYAYADGTFSKTFITSKTLMGMIYAKRVNPQDNSKFDLKILGNKTVSGLCSPDYYMRSSNQFDVERNEGKNQNKIFNLLTQLFYADSTTGSSMPPLTDAGMYNSQTYTPYYAIDFMSVPSGTITMATDISYPVRSGKDNILVYKTIANEHLRILAEEDAGDFGRYMKVSNKYMNGANEMQDITSVEFDLICEYFNTRLATVVPTGGAAQGALISNSYAQLLYPIFYQAYLYDPEIKPGESLFEGYAKGNWYVPSVEETAVLISHRIRSTTTTTNTSQSATDWNSVEYTGKGIFTANNKAHFDGFLTRQGNGGTYSCMTSDISNNTGFSIVYGEYKQYGSPDQQKWFGSWSYYNATQGSGYDSSAHVNCQRDKTYIMPLCCEITVSKQ